MEMTCLRRARSRDRRRRICAYSRYAWTPLHLILEVNTEKFTQQAILERWPVEGEAPDRSTLSRWLQRTTRQGMVCCCGTGYRGDPFLHWLPGREPLLWPGYHASEEEKQAWRDRLAEHYRSPHKQTTAT
jgi:hypothetical protein